jgi:predicted glycosyltransferase
VSRPALLFYCQHSVGLGHLMRSYALCRALTERFRVVFVSGGQRPDGIEPPGGVELVALPPLGVGANGRFESHDRRFTVERAWTARRDRILGVFDDVQPAVVLVELFPFGRARFARELVPLLEAARAANAATACSLRDILVSRRSDQRAHDERACALANAYLDAVLVHADPGFARLEDTFGARRRLAVPVRYTGFVVDGGGDRGAGSHVLVSAGGGRVGGPLLRAAAEAQRIAGVPMRLVAGPFCPEEDRRALEASAIAQDGLDVVPTVPDLGAELRRAAASVSQCGYNTALEIVRARVPALVVPYATPEEDEQRRRARRLARLGALRVLEPDRLDPVTLAEAIEALPAFEPAAPRIDLDGARRTTDLVCELAHATRRAEARSA